MDFFEYFTDRQQNFSIETNPTLRTTYFPNRIGIMLDYPQEPTDHAAEQETPADSRADRKRAWIAVGIIVGLLLLCAFLRPEYRFQDLDAETKATVDDAYDVVSGTLRRYCWRW